MPLFNRFYFPGGAAPGPTPPVNALTGWSFAQEPQPLWLEDEARTALGGSVRRVEPGRALRFNGVDGTVQLPVASNYLLPTAGTVAGWVFPTSTNFGYLISHFDSGDRVYVFLNGSPAQIRVGLGDNGDMNFGTAPGVVPLNAWSHVALTYDSGNWSTWMNGMLIESGTYTGLTGVNQAGWIGSFTGSSSFADFDLDSWAAFQRALNATEMQQLANSTVPSGVTNLLEFEESSGGIAYDASGNGNHGSHSGGVTHITHPGTRLAAESVILDGSSGYVDSVAPGAANTSYELRIVFQAKFGTQILYQSNGIRLRLNSTNIEFTHDNTTVNLAINHGDNNWHEAVVTWDGNNIVLTTDLGSASGTDPDSLNLTDPGRIGSLSAGGGGPGGYLNGHVASCKLTVDGSVVFDYDFDDGSGTTATDTSGNNNDGTLVGGVTWNKPDHAVNNRLGYTLSGNVRIPAVNATTDATGGALTYTGDCPKHGLLYSSNGIGLNGIDQAVEFTSPIDLLSDFTVDIWISAQGSASFDKIINLQPTADTQFQLGHTPDDLGRFVASLDRSGTRVIGSGTSGESYGGSGIWPNDEGWKRITYRVSGTTGTLWMDNVELAAGNLQGAGNVSGANSRWGSRSNGSHWFQGQLVKGRIFSSALTPDQIDAGAVPVYFNPFAEGPGPTRYNVVSNSNHGTDVSTPTPINQDVFHYNINNGFTRRGVDFDGVDGYVDTPAVPGTVTSYKITSRISSTVLPNGIVLDARDSGSDGFRLRYFTQQLDLSHNATVLTAATGALNDGELHDVVAEWDGATIKITVDGSEFSQSESGAIDVSTAMRIGARSFTSPDTYFNGTVQFMVVEVNGVEILNYQLTEGTGQPQDTSGNNNHGTLNGGATWSNTYIPALLSGATDASGGELLNGKVVGHNFAETLVDFTAFAPLKYDPEINGLNVTDGYAAGDALPITMSKRVVEAMKREDQFIVKKL